MGTWDEAGAGDLGGEESLRTRSGYVWMRFFAARSAFGRSAAAPSAVRASSALGSGPCTVCTQGEPEGGVQAVHHPLRARCLRWGQLHDGGGPSAAWGFRTRTFTVN